jgi:hypothetical protein
MNVITAFGLFENALSAGTSGATRWGVVTINSVISADRLRVRPLIDQLFISRMCDAQQVLTHLGR